MADVRGGERRRLLLAHPSPDVYGSDLQMLESLSALLRAGWRVCVVLPHGGPLEALIVERGGTVAVVGYPVLSKALRSPRGLLAFVWSGAIATARLTRLLRRSRPAMTYVNTLTIPVWLIACRLARVPSLCHVHEAEDDQPRLVRRALAAPLLLTKVVVTNSRAATRVLVESAPRLESSIRTVHNGIPEPGATVTPPRPRRSSDPFSLVLVGRLSPRKGTDVALEAVAELVRRGLDVDITLCGSVFPGYEWFEDQLRERARGADLEGRVTFAGYVNPTWPALARADAAIVPSRAEPFGNVAVEAQLAMRPVVVSDVQGLAEIVDTEAVGLRVPPGDPRALADALERLARDPLFASTIADAARAAAQSRFSVQTYAAAIAAAVAETTPAM